MNNDDDRLLEKFYKKLCNQIIRKKRLSNNSVILTFIKTTANNASKILRNASLSDIDLLKKDVNNLRDQGFIRTTDAPDRFTLTAKGVWHIEKKLEILRDDVLIDFFDKRKFDFFGEVNPLTEKEKIIIFSMIAVRAFSKKSIVDLTKNRIEWRKIVLKTFRFLKGLQIIERIQKENLFGKARAEEPIVNLFRHTNDLPKKTKSIFTSTGDLSYFLNMTDDNKINDRKLSLLFWLIMGDKLLKNKNEASLYKVNEVTNFLNKMSANESIILFEPDTHPFTEYRYDDIIKEALIDSIASGKRWED